MAKDNHRSLSTWQMRTLIYLPGPIAITVMSLWTRSFRIDMFAFLAVLILMFLLGERKFGLTAPSDSKRFMGPALILIPGPAAKLFELFDNHNLSWATMTTNIFNAKYLRVLLIVAACLLPSYLFINFQFGRIKGKQGVQF